ncbi:hypothetical protein F5Y04DRAFT_274334 [Hypomontagnella monticulosa]|nr:hypothetical protein F5Y04DRAFT_274334 [Hypomontagnella monticulosa]
MSYTQDKAHSSALLSAIQEGEKAQEQSRSTASDSASIFSTSSFGSMKGLLKKGKSSKESGAADKTPIEVELSRKALQNQVGRAPELHTKQRGRGFDTRMGPALGPKPSRLEL